MGSLSIWHWLIVLAVVLLLFGGGKVSTLMGDFAKGIKAFKKNMAEEGDVSMEATERPPGSIAAPNAPIATAAPHVMAPAPVMTPQPMAPQPMAPQPGPREPSTVQHG